MHELSIAISLVNIAVEEFGWQRGDRVTAVHLRLGPLSGVVREALLSAYEAASEQSPLAGSRLLIEDVPIKIFCPACRCEREVESIQKMSCNVCGTPSAEVVSGRELELFALEISDDAIRQNQVERDAAIG